MPAENMTANESQSKGGKAVTFDLIPRPESTESDTSDKKDKKKEEVPPPPTKGVYIFPNGDKYDGEYQHGSDGSLERNGYGVHTTTEGAVYEGEWKGDKMNGRGKLAHPSGALYEGEFVNNQFHGQGKYTWKNNSFYEGQFKENKMEGTGQFTDTEGQMWTGTFRYKAAPGLRFELKMN
uniref:MORN repeat-containing protein 1-like isoform X1 n=1 Tax=Crassostrea virginica TaxID=6565 RepID=A0A8B8DKD1_CRAVI|nr:MORN repeat-containing protein 1-like isoform X1 [Crassostrea virginica]